MQTGSRIGWTIVLTVALGANIGLMFATGAKKFEPVWFSIALAAFAVLVLLVWVLGRGKSSRSGETIDLEQDLPPVGTKHSSSTWSMPTRPGETVTGLPTIEVAPRNIADAVVEPAPAAPVAFAEKGFTLFARTVKGKTSYVFSKGRVIGGVAVPMPDGFSVGWDKKAKKPILEAIETAAPAMQEEDDSLTAGIATPVRASAEFDVRRCAAMPTPGDFCGNPAKHGEKYCSKHTGFQTFSTTLVVRPDGREGKAVRGLKIKAPEFIVRTPRGVTAKGSGLKTVRTTLDVRTVKPKAAKALRFGSAAVEFETPRGNKPAKALRVAEPRLDIHAPETHMPQAMRVAEPRLAIRQSSPSNARPLRVAEPRLDIRGGSVAEARPLKVKEPVLNLRPAKTGATKALRVKEPVLQIREPTTARSKPLKVKEPVLNIREPSTAQAKPLKVKEPILNFRKQPKNTSPPLKIRETYLDIRAPRSHGVRPMKLEEPDVDVRTSKPKNKAKALRAVDPVLDLHPAESHMPHAMRVTEPQVVVRPKKQLADGKPFKVVETELEIVRSKPKNLGAFKGVVVAKDPDVVADTKKRSSIGTPPSASKRRK